MRTVLFLVLVSLAVACGGENPYDNQNQPAGAGGAPAGGGAAAATPAAPERPKMSPEASEIMMAQRAAKGAPDSKASALEKLPKWENRTLPPDAYYYLAFLHQYAEQHDQAAATFEKFVKQAPPEDSNHRTALYFLVKELVAAGRPGDAVPYAEQFEQKYTDLESQTYARDFRSSLADAFAARGEFDKATPHYGRAFELGSYFSGEEYVMGLWALGKYEDARTAAGKLASYADQSEMERAKHFAALAEKMGKPAPKLDVEAWVNPEGFDASRLAGKVVLVYFWTTGNQNQAVKIEKKLMEIWKEHAGDDFSIVGVSKHDQYSVVERVKKDEWGTADEVKNLNIWVQNSGMWHGEGNLTPWHLALVADTAVHDAFGYTGKTPTIALIGKDGKYRYFRQSEAYAQIGQLVGKLIRE